MDSVKFSENMIELSDDIEDAVYMICATGC